MSTKLITAINPKTAEREPASICPGYFGMGLSAVRFDSDNEYYPIEQVEGVQDKEKPGEIQNR